MHFETVSREEAKCVCVGKHVPLPMALHLHHIVPKEYGGGEEESNKVYICPTTHYNIHSLLQKYEKFKTTPPGKVRKHYSEYVQNLAARAWEGRKQNGKTTFSAVPLQSGQDNVSDEHSSMASDTIDISAE